MKVNKTVLCMMALFLITAATCLTFFLGVPAVGPAVDLPQENEQLCQTTLKEYTF